MEISYKKYAAVFFLLAFFNALINTDLYWDDNYWLLAYLHSTSLYEFLSTGWLDLRRPLQGLQWYALGTLATKLEGGSYVVRALCVGEFALTGVLLCLLVKRISGSQITAVCVALTFLLFPLSSSSYFYWSDINYRWSGLLWTLSFYFSAVGCSRRAGGKWFHFAALLAAVGGVMSHAASILFEVCRVVVIFGVIGGQRGEPLRLSKALVIMTLRTWWLHVVVITVVGAIVISFSPVGVYAGEYGNLINNAFSGLGSSESIKNLVRWIGAMWHPVTGLHGLNYAGLRYSNITDYASLILSGTAALLVMVLIMRKMWFEDAKELSGSVTARAASFILEKRKDWGIGRVSSRLCNFGYREYLFASGLACGVISVCVYLLAVESTSIRWIATHGLIYGGLLVVAGKLTERNRYFKSDIFRLSGFILGGGVLLNAVLPEGFSVPVTDYVNLERTNMVSIAYGIIGLSTLLPLWKAIYVEKVFVFSLAITYGFFVAGVGESSFFRVMALAMIFVPAAIMVLEKTVVPKPLLISRWARHSLAKSGQKQAASLTRYIGFHMPREVLLIVMGITIIITQYCIVRATNRSISPGMSSDHFYLAGLGVAMVVGTFWSLVMRRLLIFGAHENRSRFSHGIIISSVPALIIGVGIYVSNSLADIHSKHTRDQLAFWEALLERYPSAPSNQDWVVSVDHDADENYRLFAMQDLDTWYDIELYLNLIYLQQGETKPFQRRRAYTMESLERQHTNVPDGVLLESIENQLWDRVAIDWEDAIYVKYRNGQIFVNEEWLGTPLEHSIIHGRGLAKYMDKPAPKTRKAVLEYPFRSLVSG